MVKLHINLVYCVPNIITRGQSNLAKGPGCHWLTAECRVQTACAATGSNRDYNSLAIPPKIVRVIQSCCILPAVALVRGQYGHSQFPQLQKLMFDSHFSSSKFTMIPNFSMDHHIFQDSVFLPTFCDCRHLYVSCVVYEIFD